MLYLLKTHRGNVNTNIYDGQYNLVVHFYYQYIQEYGIQYPWYIWGQKYRYILHQLKIVDKDFDFWGEKVNKSTH